MSPEALKQVETQFTVAYELLALQEALKTLSMEQIMAIISLRAPLTSVSAPSDTPVPLGDVAKQLAAIRDIQTLFTLLDATTLIHLHQEINQIATENPGEEVEALPRLVDLGVDHFNLYEPLRLFLQLPLPDVLVLLQRLPALSATQLGHLARLADLGPFDISAFHALLAGPPSISSGPPLPSGDAMELDPPPSSSSLAASGSPVAPRSTHGLTVTIVDQPPEKCVYKRNVKPPPSVQVNGNLHAVDGQLYIVPVLSRCDTQEDMPQAITGNNPVKIGASQTLPFPRLKVLVTTHQLSEAMFSLRFELRLYNGDDFELLDTATSDPFQVVSHSTQLRPSSRSLPQVVEVLPFTGAPSGATRVCILGTNFLDSPTTRVRFDDVEVIPIFHGAKTLICHTPKHAPGLVNVFVANEPNAWGTKAGTFTYDTLSLLAVTCSFWLVTTTIHRRKTRRHRRASLMLSRLRSRPVPSLSSPPWARRALSPPRLGLNSTPRALASRRALSRLDDLIV
jgi:hypothetical protein